MGPERASTDFGSKLRAARERRGVSLRQIASATKISLGALDALERNDLARLPGGIFSRAFVRSYASEVGLDPDEAIEEFLSQFPRDAAPPAHAAAEGGDDRDAIESDRRTASTFLRLIAISIPIAAAVVYFAASGRTPVVPPAASSGTVESAPANTAATEIPSPSVVTAGAAVNPAAPPVSSLSAQVRPTPPSPPAEARPAAPGDTTASDAASLTVDLSIRRPCWLSLTVDGEKKAERLFEAGERQTIQVARELSFTAGDASAVRMTINGANAKPLGREGEVVTARVNLHNFKSYLASR